MKLQSIQLSTGGWANNYVNEQAWCQAFNKGQSRIWWPSAALIEDGKPNPYVEISSAPCILLFPAPLSQIVLAKYGDDAKKPEKMQAALAKLVGWKHYYSNGINPDTNTQVGPERHLLVDQATGEWRYSEVNSNAAQCGVATDLNAVFAKLSKPEPQEVAASDDTGSDQPDF